MYYVLMGYKKNGNMDAFGFHESLSTALKYSTHKRYTKDEYEKNSKLLAIIKQKPNTNWENVLDTKKFDIMLDEHERPIYNCNEKIVFVDLTRKLSKRLDGYLTSDQIYMIELYQKKEGVI